MEYKINVNADKEKIRKDFEENIDQYVLPVGVAKETIVENATNLLYGDQLLCEVSLKVMQEAGYSKLCEIHTKDIQLVYYIQYPNLEINKNPFDNVNIIIYNKNTLKFKQYTLHKDVIYISYLLMNNKFKLFELGTVRDCDNERLLVCDTLYKNGVIKYNEKHGIITNMVCRTMGEVIRIYPNRHFTHISSISIPEEVKKDVNKIAEDMNFIMYYENVYDSDTHRMVSTESLTITKELLLALNDFYLKVLKDTATLKKNQSDSIEQLDAQIMQLKNTITTLEQKKKELQDSEIIKESEKLNGTHKD